MDMLDQALDSSQDKTNDSANSDDQVHLTGPDGEHSEEQATAIATVTNAAGGTLTLDPNIQYQFRADTGQAGQVTYRVVQVAPDGSEGGAQVVTTAAFPAGAQAVIQSPFSNGGSPTPDGQPETRFTYFPAVSAGQGDGVVTTQTEVVNAAGLGAVAAPGGLAAGQWQSDQSLPQDMQLNEGQFYVMMSPQDVLQGQRNIAPRTTFAPKIEGRSTRDDRRRATHNEGRRATHNEVERRRRDKINNWIVQLSKLVPDCSQDHTKQGQVGSKGGILAKACDYITELRTANARMAESLKETERLSVDAELLRQQCEELKNENGMLRGHLSQHGIVLPDMSGGS